MSKKKSPLKIGKETYGSMNRKEAFIKALEPYFTYDGMSNNKKNRMRGPSSDE